MISDEINKPENEELRWLLKSAIIELYETGHGESDHWNKRTTIVDEEPLGVLIKHKYIECVRSMIGCYGSREENFMMAIREVKTKRDKHIESEHGCEVCKRIAEAMERKRQRAERGSNKE